MAIRVSNGCTPKTSIPPAPRDAVPDPRILVVDDEENIRHMLALMLRKGGYAVQTANDGAEALEKLHIYDFEAVLCDLNMPNMGGMGLLAALAEQRTEATVIIMSAYADIDDALGAIRAGAYDYIAKPFKRDEVLFTLRKAAENKRLREENATLKTAARGAHTMEGIVSRSEKIARVFTILRKVADYKTTVLLAGESGTGKEMFARALHRTSSRAAGPFVTVNCGAIPEALLESELFGHVKGAFTDAHRDKKGLVLEAEGGTMLLDEIGDMPLSLQVKLLRVLQENEIRRVGETRPTSIDVRFIAASIHELVDLVAKGAFREDLFYRLNVLPITLPPLRERPEDVPLLLEHFIARHNTVMKTQVRGVSPRAMSALVAYQWPGNVRELENVVERAMVLTESPIIELESLPDAVQQRDDSIRQIFDSDDLSVKKASRALETTLIARALRETNGNRTAASKLLEISHRALLYKLKDYFPDGIPGD
ncbi:MAG: two-component system response regulator AtoC [Bradymonadia bacterium]|jgi:two-component system response regulator AtoC